MRQFRQAPAEAAGPRFEDHLRLAVAEFDEARFVRPAGVMTIMVECLEGAPGVDPSPRKDAIQLLTEWIKEEKAPPYCALLGDYRMGETTTCKALARDLLRRRDRDHKIPWPIYLDLRYVGLGARQELTLDQILALILKRSWKGGPGDARLRSQELIALAGSGGAPHRRAAPVPPYGPLLAGARPRQAPAHA